jgi:hypothetical protein
MVNLGLFYHCFTNFKSYLILFNRKQQKILTPDGYGYQPTMHQVLPLFPPLKIGSLHQYAGGGRAYHSSFLGSEISIEMNKTILLLAKCTFLRVEP